MREICEMNYEELIALRNEINKEINRQESENREADWLIVVDAIKKYCIKYGSIEVIDRYGDSCHFDDTWNFSAVGEIQ